MMRNKRHKKEKCIPSGTRTTDLRIFRIILPAAALTAAVCCALCLWLIPAARLGFQALCNRVFAASEAVNSYQYVYFPVADTQGAALAVALLIILLLCLCVLIICSDRSFPALIFGIALCALQIYFGLPFPGWVNILIYGALGLKMLVSHIHVKKAAVYAGSLLLISAAVFLFCPGTEEMVETASEQVRDHLTPAAFSEDDGLQMTADERIMTRHFSRKTLREGMEESDTGQTYRIGQHEERNISRPEWVDILRTVVLFLLVALLLIAPFLPFLLMGGKRRYLQERIRSCSSEDLREAVTALFFFTTSWLEASGCGKPGVLYRNWPESWQGIIPQTYVHQFLIGTDIYEQAVYSNHPLQEIHREQMQELLEETKELVLGRANWRERLRLRVIFHV